MARVALVMVFAGRIVVDVVEIIEERVVVWGSAAMENVS